MFFCCCTNCTIATDNFNRADSSTVDGWTEEIGDWEIASNRLKPNGLGTILFNTEDPEDPADDGILWQSKGNFGGATGVLDWLVDCDVATGEAFYAQVVCTGETTATLYLIDDRDASSNILASMPLTGFDWSTDFTIAVCLGYQFTVPACSSGTTSWTWEEIEDPDGNYFIWRGGVMTGNCAEPGCIPTRPDFDGTVEGQVENTPCTPMIGNEGSEVYALSASFNGAQSVSAAAESHGHTKVGFRNGDTSTTARFDDAALNRLRSGCPNCGSSAPACDSGCGGNVPSMWLIEFEGIANVAADPVVCNCDDANRAMLLPASALPCRWQEYDSPPAWEYCPGEELEGVDGNHIWAGEVFIPENKLLQLLVRQPPIEDGPEVGFGEPIAVFEGEVPDETNCDEVERLELFTSADLSEVLVDLGLLGEFEICDYTGWRVFISAVA